MKKIIGFSVALLVLGCFSSCKNKNPSIAKIFVKTSFQMQGGVIVPYDSPEAVNDAKVIIIAKSDENAVTTEYVDTLETNENGYAEFNLEPFYETFGKDDDMIAEFDIVAKIGNMETEGEIRTRAHIVSVETVVFRP